MHKHSCTAGSPEFLDIRERVESIFKKYGQRLEWADVPAEFERLDVN